MRRGGTTGRVDPRTSLLEALWKPVFRQGPSERENLSQRVDPGPVPGTIDGSQHHPVNTLRKGKNCPRDGGRFLAAYGHELDQ